METTTINQRVLEQIENGLYWAVFPESQGIEYALSNGFVYETQEEAQKDALSYYRQDNPSQANKSDELILVSKNYDYWVMDLREWLKDAK